MTIIANELIKIFMILGNNYNDFNSLSLRNSVVASFSLYSHDLYLSMSPSFQILCLVVLVAAFT